MKSVLKFLSTTRVRETLYPKKVQIISENNICNNLQDFQNSSSINDVSAGIIIEFATKLHRDVLKSEPGPRCLTRARRSSSLVLDLEVQYSFTKSSSGLLK